MITINHDDYWGNEGERSVSESEMSHRSPQLFRGKSCWETKLARQLACMSSNPDLTQKTKFFFKFFFKDPFQERAVDQTYTLIHSPVSAITSTSSSIEFQIPGKNINLIYHVSIVKLS